MADAVDRNKLMAEVVALTGLAKKTHGVIFFGDLVEQPFNAEQKADVVQQLKSLMQRTHPDKTDGFDDQFWQLQDALSYVRSNVDLTKDKSMLEVKNR